MKHDNLRIIDEFINGYEEWQSSFTTMRMVGKIECNFCPICGIDPKKVKKLKDAVEEIRDLISNKK